MGKEAVPEIPGYEILEELGRGGMGVVWKARRRDLGRLVALKMIRTGTGATREELVRFRQEAKAVARLQHPNIVQIYAVGEVDGCPFLELELCTGGTLGQALARQGVSSTEAARLIELLARVLQHAHDQGVVHRDLKPSNILLAADGTPRLTDFGLARMLDNSLGHTLTGLILGTPSYMSPEQARGKTREIGPAVDIYGLGAVLYELLTGRPPYPLGPALETLQRVLTEETVPPRVLAPHVPRDLETICLKCLEKEARHRYASAKDLADDLRCFQEGRSLRNRPVGPLTRLARWCQRREHIAGGGALAAGISALMLVWSLFLLGATLMGVLRSEVPSRTYLFGGIMVGAVYLPLLGISCLVVAGKKAAIGAGISYTLALVVWMAAATLLDFLGIIPYHDYSGFNIDPSFRLTVDILIFLLFLVQLAAYSVALVARRAHADNLPGSP